MRLFHIFLFSVLTIVFTVSRAFILFTATVRGQTGILGTGEELQRKVEISR
jgi:hypothetical protein